MRIYREIFKSALPYLYFNFGKYMRTVLEWKMKVQSHLIFHWLYYTILEIERKLEVNIKSCKEIWVFTHIHI